MPRLSSALAVLAAALTCLASPTPLEVKALDPSQTDRLVQEGIDLARSSGLEKRIRADFSMDMALNNTVLFDTYGTPRNRRPGRYSSTRVPPLTGWV